MNVTGERYYRLIDGDTQISQHQSKEECIERAVKVAQSKGPGKHKLTMVPPTKTIEVEVA